MPGNYRPVYLTSVVGKLLERNLRVRISQHLIRKGIIRDSQHIFVHEKLYLPNLREFFKEVTKGFGTKMDIVYMGISKTFDKDPYGGQSGSR